MTPGKLHARRNRARGRVTCLTAPVAPAAIGSRSLDPGRRTAATAARPVPHSGRRQDVEISLHRTRRGARPRGVRAASHGPGHVLHDADASRYLGVYDRRRRRRHQRATRPRRGHGHGRRWRDDSVDQISSAPGADTSSAAGAPSPTAWPRRSDTSGMQGRHAADSTQAGLHDESRGPESEPRTAVDSAGRALALPPTSP